MALHLTLAGKVHEIEIVRRKPNLLLRVDGRLHEVAPRDGERDESRDVLMVDGMEFAFTRAFQSEGDGETAFVRHEGRTYDVGFIDPRAESAGHDTSRDEIHAPMPGAVVSVHKKPGEATTRGETLVTIESMKLQTALAAQRDGIVQDILRGEGETFEKDEVLVRLAPAAEG